MLPFPRLAQYANTVESSPVFLMKDFNTTADIKDKGPHSIPITNNGNLPVGSDQYGTYINFTGNTSQWLEFSSSHLDLGQCEITMVLGNFQYRNTQYGSAILDCRPYQTNGPYFLLGYSSSTPAPFNVSVTYNSSQTLATPKIDSDLYPITLKIQIRTTGTTIFINGNPVATSNYTINFVNQKFKVGRNAFIATAAVPYLNAKIYKFEIRKFV